MQPQLAWQAYHDVEDATTISGSGLLELDKLNYELVERLYDEEHDAYALICRHKFQHRLVLSFRGSSSKAHWYESSKHIHKLFDRATTSRQANMKFKQTEFNLLKEKLLQIDTADGLGALETGIGREYFAQAK